MEAELNGFYLWREVLSFVSWGLTKYTQIEMRPHVNSSKTIILH